MSRTCAGLIALLLALPAAAQEVPLPPPEELGYYQRCFGVPREDPHTAVSIALYSAQDVGPENSGVGKLASAAGSSDDKVFLIIAVLALAVLPVVVYSLDSEPPRLVLQRFQCPTFHLELLGGSETSKGELNGNFQALATGRFEFGAGHFATDVQYDGSAAVSSFATHLLVRGTPRTHIDLALALGYRRSTFRGLSQDGFEIGLPHRYVLWRESLRSVALEIRPALLVGNDGVEPSLEGAVLLPIVDVMQLRAGVRVFTFQGAIFWGMQGGLGLTL